MQLPENTTIEKRKLTEYLLRFQEKDDKSKFLENAGYSIENWEVLETDLRLFLLNNDATFVHSATFGDYYEITGYLQ